MNLKNLSLKYKLIALFILISLVVPVGFALAAEPVGVIEARDEEKGPPQGDDDDDDDDEGSKTITAKALYGHECNDKEWHFVITQIDDKDNAPDSIYVEWGNGDSENVPLDKFTGGTAHYTTTSNLDSPVVYAEADIYGDWSGQFNLSHGPCDFGDDDDNANDDDDDIVDDDDDVIEDDDDDVVEDDDDDVVEDDDDDTSGDDDDAGGDDDDDVYVLQYCLDGQRVFLDSRTAGDLQPIKDEDPCEAELPILGPIEAVAPATGGLAVNPVLIGGVGLGLLGAARLGWSLLKRR